MTPALGILCYHRIVAGDDDTAWPYLERGTAVRTETFQAQLADLARFADIVGEDVALDVLGERHQLDRPAVWLTFDDGYRDVKEVLPQAEAGTVFVTTSGAERLLPADAWYALLLSAGRTRGVLDLGLGPFEFDLCDRAGRARLVDGPERRAYLRAPRATRDAVLRRLAPLLEAPLDASSPYLDASDLRAVLRAGWGVGSHGVTHTPFDALTADAVRSEAVASREALRALGASGRSIALPDGAQAHVDVLEQAGFECVLGLGDAPCALGVDVQPRFLVPDDPAWATRVLEPALVGGARG
ncbi:MAG: polysaccharide deacetylase family protein [Kofleriaceae bacterium]